MPLDYPLWLRATHFFNFLLLSLLVRSGLEILSAHPSALGAFNDSRIFAPTIYLKDNQ
jgi:hypothetical protein